MTSLISKFKLIFLYFIKIKSGEKEKCFWRYFILAGNRCQRRDQFPIQIGGASRFVPMSFGWFSESSTTGKYCVIASSPNHVLQVMRWRTCIGKWNSRIVEESLTDRGKTFQKGEGPSRNCDLAHKSPRRWRGILVVRWDPRGFALSVFFCFFPLFSYIYFKKCIRPSAALALAFSSGVGSWTRTPQLRITEI